MTKAKPILLTTECARCKKTPSWLSKREEWFRLITEDGQIVWLCAKCFNVPIEDMFYPVNQERPNCTKVKDF